MKPTRRDFVKLGGSLGLLAAAKLHPDLLAVQSVREDATRPPAPPSARPPRSAHTATPDYKTRWRRDLRVHVSHYGYHPDHPKRVICTPPLPDAREFTVHTAADGAVAFRGALRPVDDDFGPLLVGDFDAFTQPGEYYAEVGGTRSFGTFRIDEHLWDELQRLVALQFFGVRRIGEDNLIGNQGDGQGVHWDNALLPGGAGWRYIGTAWADGNDRRVYPSCSLVVAQYCRLAHTRPWWDTGDWIYQQVRWGLDGALSFLEHDGLLRGMLAQMPDRDTDLSFYSGDEKIFADAFDQKANVNEYDLTNREVVWASLLIGPAEAALTFGDRDPEFFARVRALVERGHARLIEALQPFLEGGWRIRDAARDPFAGKFTSAAWAWLSIVLHRLTGRNAYLTAAVGAADQLLALQQADPLGDETLQLSGWFRRRADEGNAANPWGEKPEQEVMLTPWLYQALFRLLELAPEHPRAPAWREAIRRFAGDFLAPGTRLNAFSFPPMKVGVAGVGLARTKGNLGYQYFASVGRMFHQLGDAAFLLQAGRLLDDRTLTDAGWRVAQWHAGVNPLGLGGIFGLSGNMPPNAHDEDTWGRSVPGGTMNGLCNDGNDQPRFLFWEHYTYGNLNALWLATAAGSRRFAQPLLLWPRETEEAAHAPTDAVPQRHRFPLRLKGGRTYRFSALAADTLPEEIHWLADGREGGSPEAGGWTDEGSFTAPRVSSVRTVRLRIERRTTDGRLLAADETDALILPVPGAPARCTTRREGPAVRISWTPAPGPLSGYAIWRRLPAGPEEVGTVFQRVWAVEATQTEWLYCLPAPHGTEFCVRAWHREGDLICGYGPPSPVSEV